MQPRARKFYDGIVSYTLGELHLAPSLMKFYVGKRIFTIVAKSFNKPVISMIYIVAYTCPLCSAHILVHGVNPQ